MNWFVFWSIVVAGLTVNYLSPRTRPFIERCAMVCKVIILATLFAILVPTMADPNKIVLGVSAPSALELIGAWFIHLWQQHQLAREPMSRAALNQLKREGITL